MSCLFSEICFTSDHLTTSISVQVGEHAASALNKYKADVDELNRKTSGQVNGGENDLNDATQV